MNELIDYPPATETAHPSRPGLTLRRVLSIATLAFLLPLISLSTGHGQGCEVPDPCSDLKVRGVILTSGHVVDYKNGCDRNGTSPSPVLRTRAHRRRADHPRQRRG